MPAADIIRLVERLDTPYGLERSVKVMPGVLAHDRCLLSVSRAALGSAPAERLLQFGNELQIPPGFAVVLPTALERADIVHFGYEAVAGHEVYKIYFEYASDMRAALAADRRARPLVHLAYKWSSPRPESGAVTRYSRVPCDTRVELEAVLRSLLPVPHAERSLRCILGVIARTDALADSGEFLVMEVEEFGNPRRSCDLNVYDAGLRLGDITDLLEVALRDFGVAPTQARSVFGRVEQKALGHLSGGIGSSGQEFLTVYFGVEGH